MILSFIYSLFLFPISAHYQLHVACVSLLISSMSRLTNEFNAHHPPLSTNHLSEPSSLSPNDTTNKLKTGSDRLAGRGDYDNQHDSDSKETQLEPPSPITTGSNGPLNNAEAVVITPPTSNSTENDATRETLLRNLLDTSSPRLDNKIVGLLSSKGKVKE